VLKLKNELQTGQQPANDEMTQNPSRERVVGSSRSAPRALSRHSPAAGQQ
jgi:hypothetical protein